MCLQVRSTSTYHKIIFAEKKRKKIKLPPNIEIDDGHFLAKIQFRIRRSYVFLVRSSALRASRQVRGLRISAFVASEGRGKGTIFRINRPPNGRPLVRSRPLALVLFLFPLVLLNLMHNTWSAPGNMSFLRFLYPCFMNLFLHLVHRPPALRRPPRDVSPPENQKGGS